MFSLKKNKAKIFCIGLNKTGTTTIERVFSEFEYKLGDQNKGELLIHDWFNRKYKSIIDFSKSADAFQDIPFSLPTTFMFLEQYFKNAKFILTIRDTEDQWYESITKFHSKLWSDGIRKPTLDDLKKAAYCYKGFAFDSNRYMFSTPENDPYNEAILKKYYSNHNYLVLEYFKSRPNKLIVINVTRDEDYLRLCKFLGKKPKSEKFPWENKTSTI
jgi:hypothetical protein